MDGPLGEPIEEYYEVVKFDEAETSDVLGTKEYCSEEKRIGTEEERDASSTKSPDERNRLLLMEVLEDYWDKLVPRARSTSTRALRPGRLVQSWRPT